MVGLRNTASKQEALVKQKLKREHARLDDPDAQYDSDADTIVSELSDTEPPTQSVEEPPLKAHKSVDRKGVRTSSEKEKRRKVKMEMSHGHQINTPGTRVEGLLSDEPLGPRVENPSLSEINPP